MNSSHLTPALKTRFSVCLRITLEFVKDIYLVGVGLSLRTVYSPAGCGILMKMISKVCFEKQYFRRAVGHWVSNELSTLPVSPSPFPTSISDYLPRHSPSAFHQDQPIQGRTVKDVVPKSHPCPHFSVPSRTSFCGPLAYDSLRMVLYSTHSFVSTGSPLITVQAFCPGSL